MNPNVRVHRAQARIAIYPGNNIRSVTMSASNVKDLKTRRPHAVRREEAEERMLKAAVKIVAERGLENLTLAECGEAAGYSRGLAPHYFGSKEELVSAIAQHIVDDYIARQRADRPPRVGLAGLLDNISFYIDSGRANPTNLRAFHAVLGSALKQTSLSENIAALNRNTVYSFAKMIRSAVERREIRGDINPIAQATLIITAMRGMLTMWLLDPNHVDLDALKKEFLGNLKRSLVL
ncbi:MAG TPA: TetR/AcrR family transcriptional regulator [Steroidobacteraceae bacterium]|nr:TetR/AcrR family transcriptional regulator [Steroidobacteraceae bacterium]